MNRVGSAGTVTLVATSGNLMVQVAVIIIRERDDSGLASDLFWLGGRDSNPDSQIQSLESYHWTTSQQRNRIYESPLSKSTAHAGILDSYRSDNFRRCRMKSFRK